MSNSDMMKVNRVQGQDTSPVSPVSYYAAAATSQVDSQIIPVLQNASRRLVKPHPEKKMHEASEGDKIIIGMNDKDFIENYNYFAVSKNLIIQKASLKAINN